MFPGCHLANLYIGMEELKMSNYSSAIDQLNCAKEVCQNDPMIFNEIGVAYYKQKNYEEAKKFLLNAQALCFEKNSDLYESIILNLAHCYRKNKNF